MIKPKKKHCKSWASYRRWHRWDGGRWTWSIMPSTDFPFKRNDTVVIYNSSPHFSFNIRMIEEGIFQVIHPQSSFEITVGTILTEGQEVHGCTRESSTTET